MKGRWLWPFIVPPDCLSFRCSAFQHCSLSLFLTLSNMSIVLCSQRLLILCNTFLHGINSFVLLNKEAIQASHPKTLKSLRPQKPVITHFPSDCGYHPCPQQDERHNKHNGHHQVGSLHPHLALHEATYTLCRDRFGLHPSLPQELPLGRSRGGILRFWVDTMVCAARQSGSTIR